MSEAETNWEGSNRDGCRAGASDAHREAAFVKSGKRRQRGDLTAVFLHLKRCYREDRARLLVEVHGKRAKGNGHNLPQGKVQPELSGKSHNGGSQTYENRHPKRLRSLRHWTFSELERSQP